MRGTVYSSLPDIRWRDRIYKAINHSRRGAACLRPGTCLRPGMCLRPGLFIKHDLARETESCGFPALTSRAEYTSTEEWLRHSRRPVGAVDRHKARSLPVVRCGSNRVWQGGADSPNPRRMAEVGTGLYAGPRSPSGLYAGPRSPGPSVDAYSALTSRASTRYGTYDHTKGCHGRDTIAWENTL
jgi:hypothetical protein